MDDSHRFTWRRRRGKDGDRGARVRGSMTKYGKEEELAGKG